MPAHLQHEHRYCKREPDPEAPRHIREFGAWFGFSGRDEGFEGHSANWAGARPDLADLRMHWAGVDHAFPSCRNAVFCFEMIDVTGMRRIMFRLGVMMVFMTHCHSFRDEKPRATKLVMCLA